MANKRSYTNGVNETQSKPPNPAWKPNWLPSILSEDESSWVLDRRQWLRLAACFGVASALPLGGCAARKVKELTADEGASQAPAELGFLPVDRSLEDRVDDNRWSGDDMERAHRLLFGGGSGGISREPQRILSSQSAPEQVEVAIVGGGMSGLLSAYWLKDQSPVILENASRLGGYSRAESWRGLDYSIGAAYITPPEKGSKIDQFLEAVGIKEFGRLNSESDPVLVQGKLERSFWEGGADPAYQEFYVRYGKLLRQVAESKDGFSYPNIPNDLGDVAQDVKDLDRITLKAYLEKSLKGKLPPQLEASIELYCRSSFGAGISEVSAASGLNFLAGEVNGTVVFPGGNAAIADALSRHLGSVLPAHRLRTSSTVTKISVNQQGVLIQYYVGSSGRPNWIRAKKVIFAAPKFVAARVIEGLEAKRLAAIRKLRYRGYLVANVLLTKGHGQDLQDFYDLYLVGNQMGAAGSTAANDGATDVTRADFALKQAMLASTQGKGSGQALEQILNQVTGLTMYRSLPWEGARQVAMNPSYLNLEKKKLTQQLERDLLPNLGKNGARPGVHQIRMTRWGHALPVASPGHLSEVCPEVRKPFKDRIYFVHQDNWALPAFETCFAESCYWTEKLKA